MFMFQFQREPALSRASWELFCFLKEEPLADSWTLSKRQERWKVSKRIFECLWRVGLLSCERQSLRMGTEQISLLGEGPPRPSRQQHICDRQWAEYQSFSQALEFCWSGGAPWRPASSPLWPASPCCSPAHTSSSTFLNHGINLLQRFRPGWHR